MICRGGVLLRQPGADGRARERQIGSDGSGDGVGLAALVMSLMENLMDEMLRM